MKLKLKKDGRLYLDSSDYGEDEKLKEVTHVAPKFLFYDIIFDENLLLWDLFAFLKRDLEFYDSLFGNWLDEYVVEGLKVERQPKTDDISHLVLDRCVEYSEYPDESKNTCNINHHFYGYGKDDGKTSWSVSMSDIKDIVNYKFVLSNEIQIHKLYWDGAKSIRKRELAKWENKQYNVNEPLTYSPFNLADVIYHVFWELSFYGGISDTEIVSNNLKQISDDIDSGKEKLISFDEVYDRLFGKDDDDD